MTTNPTEPIVSDECEPDPYWELDEQDRADFIAAEIFGWPQDSLNGRRQEGAA